MHTFSAALLLALSASPLALARPQPATQVLQNRAPNPQPSMIPSSSDSNGSVTDGTSGNTGATGSVPGPIECSTEGSPLNVAACNALLQNHLPTIMQTQEQGFWDKSQTYSWDLTNYKGPGTYRPRDCVLTWAARDQSAPEPTIGVAPWIFMQDASDVISSCPSFGGKKLFSTATMFYAGIKTETVAGS